MALALLLILSGITLASAYFFNHAFLLMPVAASSTAQAIDQSLWRNVVVVGAVFVVSQGLLAVLVYRFRASRPTGAMRPISYERSIEFSAIAVAVILFMGMNITGQSTWAKVSPIGSTASTSPIHVEVVGEQFRWYFHYPGADGVFGKTRTELQDASVGNPLGLDKSDPTATDDIVTSLLTIPAASDVQITLRTHDVIHSFFIPALRLKQDTLPGTPIELLLKVETPGSYEIACAELCGLGHHTMNAKMRVISQREFAEWAKAPR
jgi:cytochrome c oxidase subunit 2